MDHNEYMEALANQRRRMGAEIDGLKIELERVRTVALAEIEKLHAALETIAKIPIPEQDNMISANMRHIAQIALGNYHD